MDEATIEAYNSQAKRYDEETRDFWEQFPRVIIDKFTEELGTAKILDIDCGPCGDAVIFRDLGLEVVCLDASRKMVEMARDKGFEAFEADLLSLPFHDAAIMAFGPTPLSSTSQKKRSTKH